MAYLKPQTPLKDLNSGDYFYPLTTIDQIITGTSRLSAFMSENGNLLNLNNIGNLSVNGNIAINGNLTGNNGIFSNRLTIGSSTLNTDYILYVHSGYSKIPYIDSTHITARHLDAAKNSIHTDHGLYIGWGAETYTRETLFFYSTGTDGTDTVSSRTQFAEINSNGLYALTRFGVNGQSTSYNLYVNGSAYFNGASYFNGNLDVRYNNFITFYGKNNNTSPMARMGYMSAISGGACHSISTGGGYQTSGAFYIWSNGCDAGNDNGGIAIDNEGVTVFGAGDAASNFTGVFRVINEDNIAAGPVFRVQKDGKAYATALYGAVWNDFAEYRAAATEEPGRVVCSDSSGIMQLSTYRLQPAGHIISDTFGCSVGRADGANTPIGVAGRVLVYPYENRDEYQIGDAVCAAPNGTVSKMTRKEIIYYPDRIIGIVDEIPKYEYWIQKLTKKGNGQPIAKVKVNGRIWVYVR